MRSPSSMMPGDLFVLIGALLVAFAPHARAQKLAVRSYGVSDELAHGVVTKLHQDQKGYIWVATQEGLSRFDGYRFTNYGRREGLAHTLINDVVSDRHGRLWVATNGAGVARLLDDPSERQRARNGSGADAPTKEGGKFIHYYIAEGGNKNTANFVNKILFDSENRLWCVTDDGLYRAREVEAADRAFEHLVPGKTPVLHEAAFMDSRERLWFGVNTQVVRITQGAWVSYTPARQADPSLSKITDLEGIHSLFEDERGRVLAADAHNLYEFIEPDNASPEGGWRKLPLRVHETQMISVALPAQESGLWLGTSGGLIHYREGQQSLYTEANGLSSKAINALLTDREGNLWIGTFGGGLCKLSAKGIISYTTEQGLPFPLVQSLAIDNDGRIYAAAGCGPSAIVEIADSRVTILQRSQQTGPYCLAAQLLQDVRGNWWISSPRGLEFSPGPRLRLQGVRDIGAAEGLPKTNSLKVTQDAEGNIWAFEVTSGNLYVLDVKRSARPRFQFVISSQAPSEFFARTPAGTFWFADRDSAWRVVNGQRVELKATEGLPTIQPRSFFLDSRGRLWIGSRYQGVVMTTEPDAEEPRFTNYTTAHGLASDTVWAIGEDNDGRIYLGTGRGLDRLDVATGRVRHFTADDGIIGSVFHTFMKDRNGHIWAASDAGVSRINPQAERASAEPPPVFISGVQVAGEDLPLPETGTREVAPLELPATRNNIMIQFVGLNYQGESALSYQYRLEGVDEDWSAPTFKREVNYASLAPGRYRFLVRAVNSQGLANEIPASLSFTILPPIWQRWWFLMLVATLLGLVVYRLYRYRVMHLLEVERVRTRIASDLHDDIGSNLTRIAILSEVAHSRLNGGGTELEKPLTAIARISRESVASMSDIVWAINPRRDSLHELIQRMRRFTGEIFAGGKIECDFRAPEDGHNIRLGADVRRDIFLIFKEAINNTARHSSCTQVVIDFRLEAPGFILIVRDDGHGFDVEAATEGQGLISMQRRAQSLQGKFILQSRPGHGTEITLKVPRRAR